MTHQTSFNCSLSLAFLALSTLGFSQQATLTPTSLSFAPQLFNLVSSGSTSQTVTLTNSGNADLIVSSIFASGGYKQTNNCSTLSTGSSCTINVTFVPGTIGAITGAITVNDNTSSSPHVVSLSGTGMAPAQLSPGSLAFGTIPVGTTSGAKSLTFTASSSSSISVNQISTSGNFAQTNNCPSTLQAGHSCTISVVFHPTVSAAVTGALSVSTTIDTSNLAYSVSLNGTGSGNVLPQISVQPKVLNFGNKGPDSVDSTKTLTVTNTSNSASVTIQDVSLSGSPNALGAFPLYKINSTTCTGMLAPGAHCQVQVAFSTTFSRLFPLSYPAALSITDTDPTSPQVIGISGKQVAELTFNPATLVFPPQPVGTTTTKTVVVTGNDTEQGLVLDTVTSGDFSVSGNLAACFVTPGAKCTMTVSFTPTQTGVINGSVTLETYPECNPFPLHHCPDPVILNLTGTGQ